MPRCLNMAFDRANPRAIEYARTLSSELVTNVTDQTKLLIRRAIGDAIEKGMPPREAARILRNVVGMTDRDWRAYSQLMLDLQARGVSPAEIGRQAERYAARAIRRRALLIARTETLRSANAGQTELWKQARDAGELPGDWEREWIVTPDDRLRDKHRKLAGARAPLDEPFKSPDGGAIEPGGEPNCRCTQGLVQKEAA